MSEELPATPKRRGKPSAFTPELIARIAERFGRGTPLKFACALEETKGVTEGNLQKYCQRHPEARELMELASARFVDAACERLAGDKDARSLRFLLQARYGEFFSTQPHIQNTVALTVNGLSPDIVAALRENMRNSIKEQRAKVIAERQAKAMPMQPSVETEPTPGAVKNWLPVKAIAVESESFKP